MTMMIVEDGFVTDLVSVTGTHVTAGMGTTEERVTVSVIGKGKGIDGDLTVTETSNVLIEEIEGDEKIGTGRPP